MKYSLLVFSALLLLARCGGKDPVPPTPDGKYSVLIGTPALPETSYSWAPAESLSDASSPQPVAMPARSTTYTVTAKTKCGTANSSVAVRVYKVKDGQLVEVK